MRSKLLFAFCSLCTLLATLVAQTTSSSDNSQPPKDNPQPAKRETVAKPMTEKQKKKKEAKLRKSSRPLTRSGSTRTSPTSSPMRRRKAFKRLKTDEEREQFIEQFWLRRDPTPDTDENEFKEEHYRRIAYANEHYASGIPGWKTDRGRIYIMYGPAGRNRIASLRRHLRAAHRRRRRRDLHLSV